MAKSLTTKALGTAGAEGTSFGVVTAVYDTPAGVVGDFFMWAKTTNEKYTSDTTSNESAFAPQRKPSPNQRAAYRMGGDVCKWCI